MFVWGGELVNVCLKLHRGWGVTLMGNKYRVVSKKPDTVHGQSVHGHHRWKDTTYAFQILGMSHQLNPACLNFINLATSFNFTLFISARGKWHWQIIRWFLLGCLPRVSSHRTSYHVQGTLIAKCCFNYFLVHSEMYYFAIIPLECYSLVRKLIIFVLEITLLCLFSGSTGK